MASCLRSTNLPRALFTCARRCIRSSSASAWAGSANAIRTTASLSPEIIEVEPVVRRGAAVVLEAPRVALHPGPHARLALARVELDRVGEMLDADLVAPSAVVEAEEQ